jgi:hypothetical protein
VPFISWLIESTADNEDYLRIITVPIQVAIFFGGILGLALGVKYKLELGLV